MKHTVKYILSVIAAYLCIYTAQSQTLSDSINNEPKRVKIAFEDLPEWQVAGALSSVKGEDLQKSFTSNVATTLYGRIPGLWTSQGSGEPGNDSPLLLSRGVSTYGGGSGLLIVIDGMPSTQDLFQQLTPQEIESVTLLKDAAATVIYGQRGANGVLMVTTKRGQISPLKASFSAQWGLQQADRMPDFLGSYDYARLYNEAQRNDGLTPTYSADDLAHYKSHDNPLFYPDVNWYDQLLRQNVPLANYNFTARGGTEIVQYNVLFNVLTNGGIYKRTEDVSDFTKNQAYIRYNFRTNVDVALARRLSLMVTLSGSVEDKTNPGNGETTDGVFNEMASIPPNAFPVKVPDVPGGAGGNSMYSNPWADITETGYTSYRARTMQASAKLNGDLGFITPGLKIAASLGFNNYFKAFSNKTRTYARYSPAGDIISGKETTLTANENNAADWQSNVAQGFLTYNRIFNKLHYVDALVIAYYENQSHINNYIWNDPSYNTPMPFKNAGWGGHFSYGYDQRYVAEFSFGYGGDDNFAPGRRFGFFPAGAIGWVASNENFLKDNSWLTYLKLRLSYGMTGNSDTGSSRFPYLQYYQGGGAYYLGTANSGVGSYVQGPSATPDATWEREKQANIGVELTLTKKINFKFDWFNRNRFDILDKPYSEIPDFLGLNLPNLNVGKVNDKGFETSLRYDGKKGDWSYFAEGSLWYAHNKITYNTQAPQPYDYLYTVGHPVGQTFGLVALGFFADQNDIDNSTKQAFAIVQPGDVKYKDLNGDNVVNNNDMTAIGYPIPEFFGGLRLGLNYKGIDFDMFFQGSAHRSVYLSGMYFQAFQNYGKISSMALNRWAYDPDNGIDTRATATYPRLSSINNQNNYQTSTFWLKNGDYLKLRSIELGYSFPKQWVSSLKFEKIRVFINGTNLFSLDHMGGLMDPESVSEGIGYPVMRSFSAGLNIQL